MPDCDCIMAPGTEGSAFSIQNTRPDLWLSADRNVGTCGARVFDGVDQRFSLATLPAYAAGDFTLEAWFYIADTSVVRSIFGTGGASTSVPGAGIFISNTPLLAYEVTDDDSHRVTNVGGAVTANVWHHVALVIDRAADLLHLYYDGALVRSDSIAALTGGMTPTGTYKAIGCYKTDGASYFWNGRLSKARIAVGYAYTLDDVIESYNLGNGKYQAELSSALAAHITYAWNLNESAGPALDCVDSNNGTELGTDATLSSDVGPREAQASDLIGGYHGTLTNFGSTTSSEWSSDTPDGSYTALKEDSVGTADGTMTGFADVDAAHVAGPDGQWGPYIPNDGSGGAAYDAWLLSAVKDSRSSNVPGTLNTRLWDEYYSEPTATGARALDGTDQRFALATNPTYGTDSCTLEAWVWTSNLAKLQYIFGTGAGAAANVGISIYISATGYLRCDVCNGTTALATSTTGVPQTLAYTWTHVAAVVNRSANTVGLYVNGVLLTTLDISSHAGASYTPTGVNKALGAFATNDTTYTLVGALSRARIYLGDALTAAEIAESYNGGKGRALSELSPALQAKVNHSWALDEDGNNNAVDSVGSNTGTQTGTSTNIASGPSIYLPAYDATLTGFTTSPRSASDVPTALAGKCKSITPGTSAKYLTTGAKTVTGLGARSVSFWIKRASNPSGTQYIITESSSDKAQYGLYSYLDTNGIFIISITKGGGVAAVHPVLVSAATVCDNAWHHVVYTWDGTTGAGKAILYVDGSPVDTDTATATTQGAASTYNLCVSGYSNGTSGTDASICRPQVWAGRALTPAEVATLYAGGDVTEGLTSEWRFMEADAITVPYGYSLRCDGADTLVQSDHEVVGAGARTISAWINVAGYGGGGYGRIVDNAKARLYVAATGRIGSTNDALEAFTLASVYSTSTWVHVAATCDTNGYTSFFINGTRAALDTAKTNNSSIPAAGTEGLNIGNNSGKTRAFNGLIGQVQVHGSVLTQAQIRSLMQTGSVGTPVGSWKFDQTLDLPYLSGCKAICNYAAASCIITTGRTVSGQGARTVTGWIRRNGNAAATEYIYSECPSSSTERGLVVYIVAADARLYVTIQNTATQFIVAYGGSVTDGVWHHFAFSWDGTTDANKAILYVDGVLVSAVTSTATTQGGVTVYDMRLLGRTGGGYGYLGELADVRVSAGVALTQAQIRSLIAGTNYTTGLTARWKFGEAARNIAACVDGYSLTFDGADDYVVLPAALPQALSGYGTASASLWCKLPAAPGGAKFLFCLDRTVGSARFTMYLTSTGLLVGACRSNAEGSSQAVTSVAALTFGMWNHLGMSVNLATNSILLYVNGAVVTTTGTPSFAQSTFAADGAVSAIGAQAGTGFISAKVDDLRLYYGSVLSAPDFALLAAGGEPATAPTARWTLDDGPQYGEPSDGDPLCIWQGHSPNPIQFDQTTLTLRPTYDQVASHGLPAIAYDGTQYFGITGKLIQATQGRVFIVARQTAAAQDTLLGEANILVNDEFLSLGCQASDGVEYRQNIIAGTEDRLTGATAVAGSWKLYEFWSDGSTIYAKVNNTLQTLTAATGANSGDWGADIPLVHATTIGGLLQSAGAMVNGFTGAISELLIYERPMLETEAANIRRLLAAKYSITLAS